MPVLSPFDRRDHIWLHTSMDLRMCLDNNLSAVACANRQSLENALLFFKYKINLLHNPTQINKKFFLNKIFQNHLTLRLIKALANIELYRALACNVYNFT